MTNIKKRISSINDAIQKYLEKDNINPEVQRNILTHLEKERDSLMKK